MFESNELRGLMYKQQRKFGCFKDDKKEKYNEKRITRLSKFTEVTHEVIKTLKLWGIPFTLCNILHSKKQKHRITTDIFIPYANIVIRQVNVNDDTDLAKQNLYYHCMKRNFYLLFIRSNESSDFVTKKLMDVIKKANEKPQIGFASYPFIEAKKPKKDPKKKRPRIKTVKVEQRK